MLTARLRLTNYLIRKLESLTDLDHDQKAKVDLKIKQLYGLKYYLIGEILKIALADVPVKPRDTERPASGTYVYEGAIYSEGYTYN